MNNKDDRIRIIDQEDIIWYIYFFVIIAALISNRLEKQFVKTDDLCYFKKAKKINIDIFKIALIIYLYFVFQNKNGLYNINIKKEPVRFVRQEYNLVASILFLVAGFIYLINERNSYEDAETGII